MRAGGAGGSGGGSSSSIGDSATNNNLGGGGGGVGDFKRADKRSSITVLVLGDGGVGKSSLISTFVSRYFSEVVPGVMTRVRLPPDPDTSCVTTIVDSQSGDAALLAAVAAKAKSQHHRQDDSLAALVERARASSLPSSAGATTAAAVTPTAAGATPSPLTPARGGGAAAVEPSSSMAGSSATASTMQSSGSSSTTGVENIDSILLVYDLDRVETFFRLENHWLPLIEKCYDGKVPVIVAENKVDLYRPSSTATSSSTSGGAAAAAAAAAAGTDHEQALARKRQQIVSLMQRFPFVRQCIKCSAKNLLRVDDIFLKAQQAVIYPFTPPLYNLETGRLTIECKRSFTRIFRMYDKDNDGLLSDSELDRFQRETYHVAIFDRDFAAWKKVVTRNNPNTEEEVLRENKFTIAGFLAIFDVFISQNRLDVVWQALRKFGYDDDLKLHIPEYVIAGRTSPSDESSVAISGSSWRLSSSAKKFLSATFHQFDSNNDGILTSSDILNMFSILPPPALPPWHPLRSAELFQECFSRPIDSPGGSGEGSPNTSLSGSLIVPAAAAMSQSLSSSGISILSAGDSLPSVNVMGHMHPVSRPLTFFEWMGFWNVVSAISPAVARAELYRLGHVEEPRKSHQSIRRHRPHRWRRPNVAPTDVGYDASLRSREIRVLVLGSEGSGKTALLNSLRTSYEGLDMKATDTSSTTRPETSTAYVKMKRSKPSHGGGGNLDSKEEEEVVVHLVFTDVPESAAASQKQHYRELSELFGSVMSPKDRVCDLAMLVFDSTVPSSLTYVKELESKFLTKETPRVYVGTKSDLIRPSEPEDGDVQTSTVVDWASVHCRELDLEDPLLTSAEVPSAGADRVKALEHLARCALSEPGIMRLRSRPFEEEERREAERRRKMMWLGGIVSVGVVLAAVGVGLLWGAGGLSKRDNNNKRSGLSWFRSWFSGKEETEMVS